jgi:hypothetical protein
VRHAVGRRGDAGRRERRDGLLPRRSPCSSAAPYPLLLRGCEQGSGDKVGMKEMRPALPIRWHGRVGRPTGGRRLIAATVGDGPWGCGGV